MHHMTCHPATILNFSSPNRCYISSRSVPANIPRVPILSPPSSLVHPEISCHPGRAGGPAHHQLNSCRPRTWQTILRSLNTKSQLRVSYWSQLSIPQQRSICLSFCVPVGDKKRCKKIYRGAFLPPLLRSSFLLANTEGCFMKAFSDCGSK